jgi:hypothetical protein
MNSVARCLGAVAVALVLAASSACSSAPTRAVAAPTPVVSEEVAGLCAGVPDAERERPFFLQRSGIQSVRELTGPQRFTKFAKSEVRGAEIAVRPTAQETRHRVARVLRCHVAWQDALMFSMSERFEDPLRVGTPDISFDETERGLVIRIAGHDRAQGEEILRRAEALLEPVVAERD